MLLTRDAVRDVTAGHLAGGSSAQPAGPSGAWHHVALARQENGQLLGAFADAIADNRQKVSGGVAPEILVAAREHPLELQQHLH